LIAHLAILQQTSVREAIRRPTARCGDDPTNAEPYRDAIFRQYQAWEPTIPNMRTELKDSLADRSPSFINGLVNWEKRWNNSKETAMLYRFQNKMYNFWPVPQIQKVITRGPAWSEEQLRQRLNEFVRSAR
jgi:hypothetical protein